MVENCHCKVCQDKTKQEYEYFFVALMKESCAFLPTHPLLALSYGRSKGHGYSKHPILRGVEQAPEVFTLGRILISTCTTVNPHQVTH